MYIFELIVKLFSPKKTEHVQTLEYQDEKTDDCEHIFLPVDSSQEVLACCKCGLVVNKKDLKDINIFKSGL